MRSMVEGPKDAFGTARLEHLTKTSGLLDNFAAK